MNLKKNFISAVGWSSFSQVFRQGWSFVIIIILAHLLEKKDFGMVGMISVFIQLLNMILNMGFESSIIQSPKLEKDTLSSLFWLNILMGIALTILSFIISPLVSGFYNISELQLIFSVLSVIFIINSFSIIQKGLLAKELKFKLLTIIEISAITLAGIASVVTAYLGWGYWSLIFQQILFAFFTTLGLWIFSSWRPSFSFNLNLIKTHLNFSINVFFFNTINFISRKSDVLLIGKFLGAEQLGLYLLAYDFIMKPLSQLMGIFTKTLFPALSKLQHDPEKFSRTYFKTLYIVIAIFSPVLILLAFWAPYFLPVILGDKWIPVIPIFQIIAVGSISILIGSPVGSIFLAKGRPDLQWKFSLFFATPIYLLGIYLGYYYLNSAWGVAIGFNIAAALVLIPGFMLALPLINKKISDLFKEIKFILLGIVLLLIPFTIYFNSSNYSLSTFLIILISCISLSLYFILLTRSDRKKFLFYKYTFLDFYKTLRIAKA